MKSYDILVLDELLIPSIIIEERHPDDDSAIHSAQSVAGRRSVEVWYGIERVFAHLSNERADIRDMATGIACDGRFWPGRLATPTGGIRATGG